LRHGREREAHEAHPHNRAAQASGKIQRESNVLRRDLLKSGLVGSAALASSIGVARGDERELDAVAAELSKELYANDGLARPIPANPTVSDLAKGLDRTLVLGGGGEYYVA
jgi:NTE family protein